MAISDDFNYVDLLSLDKAKLVKRDRQNFLGTKELTLDYRLQTAGAKEDCVEWLTANRLSLIDPYFTFKTYEGTWTCVSIGYTEDVAVIRQIFKIDSSIGNLGDATDEPDYSLQEGDVARLSDGMEVQRAYYWRISNPERINLPPSSIEGEIWTKSATDNGDGTYDVTVSREIAQILEAASAQQYGGTASESDDIEVTEAGTSSVNGTYVKQVGQSSGKDYWYSGSYYLYWSSLDDGQWAFNASLGGGTVLYYIPSTSDYPPSSGYTVTLSATAPGPVLSSGGGIGGPYNESTEVNTNDVERSFVDSGDGSEDVPEAVDGQIKTIENSPLENGKFRSRITTREAKSMRVPSVEGTFFSYASDGWPFLAKSFINGRNRTYEEFSDDSQLLADDIYYRNRINNISMRVNDFGLFDYTITSNEPS